MLGSGHAGVHCAGLYHTETRSVFSCTKGGGRTQGEPGRWHPWSNSAIQRKSFLDPARLGALRLRRTWTSGCWRAHGAPGDSGASRRLGPRLARAVQAPHTGRGPGGGCRGPGGCRPSRQSRAAWWQPFLGGARGSQLSQGRRELVWGPARRPPTPAPTAAPGLCALGPSAAPTRSLVGPWSPRSPGHCRLRKPGTTAGLQDGSLTQESTLFRAKGT